MSTGIKVLLWIVGIVGALIVLLIVGGIFVGKSVMGDVNEAQTFAANATHEQCVDEMAKRINGCDGVNCIMKTSVFGGTCLGMAKGDRAAFCATIPASGDQEGVKAWTSEFCEKRQMNEDNCGIGAGIIVAFCSADAGQQEQKSPSN